MRIVNARIRPLRKAPLPPMAQVIATFEDGSSKSVFSFYPDEITVESSEVVGLTEQEALELHHRKDLSFLEMCAGRFQPMLQEPEMATKPAPRRNRRRARMAGGALHS